MKSKQSAPLLLVLIGGLALGITIWFGLPLVPGIRNTDWVSPTKRAILLGTLSTLWLLALGIRALLRRRSRKRFIRHLISSTESAPAPGSLQSIGDARAHPRGKRRHWWQRRHHAIDDSSGIKRAPFEVSFSGEAAPFGSIEQQQASVREHFKGILWTTRSIRDAKGKNQPLQDLPWFLVVGRSGVGKSSFLQHADLPFPMDEVQAQNPINGSGASRDCQWWFHRDAVLIEAAGRFFSRDSIAEDDEGDWNTFLNFLSGFPSGTPIRGVIVLVDIEDILEPQRREVQVPILRERMAELRQRLGEQQHFWLALTQMDKILGFNESFEQASPAYRRHYWGIFPSLQSGPPSGPDTNPYGDQAGTLSAGVDGDWDDLLRRLDASSMERLQAEPALPLRLSSFSFPDQLQGFKPALLEFVRELFDDSADPTPISGLFLTSPTQEPATRDWVSPQVRDQFDAAGQLPLITPALPRGYFVQGLIHKIAIPSTTHSASTSPRPGWLALRRAVQTVLILGTLTILASWTYNTYENKRLTADLRLQVLRARATLAQLPPNSDKPSDLVPALNTLLRASRIFPSYPPLLLRTGLYQGTQLQPATKLAYQRALRSLLLPRMTRQLEATLKSRSALRTQKRQALALYSVLDDPQQLDKEDFGDWFLQQWQADPALPVDERKSLQWHLKTLLRLRIPPQTLDYELIAKASR
jgi:type VI secretion system protein ImpL